GTDLGGLQVGDPDSLYALDGRQLGQQLLEQPQVAEVLAVGRGVLADQEDLTHAALGQPARLLDDLVRATGDERATEHRDRAEGAAPVAARGDLQRGPRAAIEAGTDHRRARRRGERVGALGVGGDKVVRPDLLVPRQRDAGAAVLARR